MPITEAMACGAPVVASSHPSLDEASGAAAVRCDPESAEAMAAAIREALGRRDELRALGLEHAQSFSWAADGRALPRGVPAILVGIDTTPLQQTRAGTARYLRGLLANLDVPVKQVSFPGHVPAAHTRRRRALVPAPARRRRRRPPLPDVPRPLPVEDAARGHRPRPRGAPPSRVVQPLDAGVLGARGAPGRRRRRPRDRRLGVDGAGAPGAARRPGGEDPGRAERSRGGLHARGAARRGRLRPRGRDARAAQEPRPNRRRRRRRAARRRRRGLGQRRAARERQVARRGDATRSSPRCTAARAAWSTRRSTRGSGSPWPRRSRAAARS